MANELFCYEQKACEADERGAVPALWAGAFADIVVQPNRSTAKYKKVRAPTLGVKGSQSSSSKISAKPSEEQLAPALAQAGNPPPLSMSGYDFYRAACVEAYSRLLNLP
jgi:hypothetical protein